MSRFYVITTQEAIDGISGLPVEQHHVSMRNGAPEVEGEVARSREPFDVTEYSKWTGEELAEMTEAEQAVYDAYKLAAWQASDEYAKRYEAVQIIGLIQTTLTSIGVTANEKSQVFADVDSWVQTSETDSVKVNRLETAMRLQTMYGRLIELVGDATGLINGDSEIDL